MGIFQILDWFVKTFSFGVKLLMVTLLVVIVSRIVYLIRTERKKRRRLQEVEKLKGANAANYPPRCEYCGLRVPFGQPRANHYRSSRACYEKLCRDVEEDNNR